MQELKAIIFKQVPDVSTYEDSDIYYDEYWQQILKYQLIFFPNNIIIFWGFKVQLSKNEYDLLKSIIKLQSSTDSDHGYTENQIVKPINYHRVNTNKPKNEAFNRFIINRTSTIKEKISNKIYAEILERIAQEKYNPFLYKDKKIKDGNVQNLHEDKKFMTKVMNSSLNLIYFHKELLGYLEYNLLPYADFVPFKAIRGLIYPLKGQKHGAAHRKYKTNYKIESKIKITEKKTYRPDKGKKKKLTFNYAPIKTKFNVDNYVN